MVSYFIGLLSFDTDEVPGNAGIFDQIEALQEHSIWEAILRKLQSQARTIAFTLSTTRQRFSIAINSVINLNK